MSATTALELIEDVHEELRDLLRQLLDAEPDQVDTRRRLLDEVGKELRMLAALEGEIFYPAFREADHEWSEVLYHEALAQQRAMTTVALPDLEHTAPGTDAFTGRALALKQLFDCHAEDAEDEIFEVARAGMSAEALRALGERMEQRKLELEGDERKA